MTFLWIIGSSNVDYVLRTRSIARPGETLIADSLQKYTGGKGFNQAVTCRQLSDKARFISTIGADQDAGLIKAKMVKAGLDRETVLEIPDHPTGAAYIQVNDEGENSIVVHSGANKCLTLEMVMRFGNLFSAGDFAVLQAELDPVETGRIINWLKDRDIRILFNLAPYTSFSKETFDGIDTLVVNDTECESLIKAFDIASFDRLGDFLNVKTVIRTRGKAGAVILENGESLAVSTKAITPVDTTGAGDAFVGGYAAARFSGLSSKRAVEIANAFGTYAATVHGAQPGFPTALKSELNQ